MKNTVSKRAARAINFALYITTFLVLLVLSMALVYLMIKAVTFRAKAADTAPGVLVEERQMTVSVDPVLAEIGSRYYYLAPWERDLVERVTMAESGGEPYAGQVLVAQCILDACLKDDLRPADAIWEYQYTSNRPDPSESVKQAVAAVFDDGELGVDAQILYFYAPARCRSAWHESQVFVLEFGGHRFFEERAR